MNGRYRVGVFAIVVALGAGAAGVDASELLDRVIAVVSGSVITLSDARTAILFGLVDTRDARDPIAVAMQWLVDRQLVLDEDGARRFVRDTLRVQQYLKMRFESILPGTDEELQQYYAANRSQFTRGGRELTLDQARDLVQQSLQESRRIRAIDAWLARLRRQAEVNELYLPVK